jgi:hypothetical protein
MRRRRCDAARGGPADRLRSDRVGCHVHAVDVTDRGAGPVEAGDRGPLGGAFGQVGAEHGGVAGQGCEAACGTPAGALAPGVGVGWTRCGPLSSPRRSGRHRHRSGRPAAVQVRRSGRDQGGGHARRIAGELLFQPDVAHPRPRRASGDRPGSKVLTFQRGLTRHRARDLSPDTRPRPRLLRSPLSPLFGAEPTANSWKV